MKFSQIKRVTALFTCLALILTIVACGNTGSQSGEKTASINTETQATTAAEDPKIDPLGKYDTPIEITTVKINYPSITYQEGDTVENNVWTRLYEEKLGIKIKYLWVVPEDQYQAKMTASFASNEIPDIVNVDEKFFKMYLDSNLAEDITDVYEKYASDTLKNLVYGGSVGESNLNYGKIGGKLMGLTAPLPNPVEGGDVLYVRTDWLKKLNLPEPKTMDDVFAISAAFAKNDPDGNGKKDTFGLTVAKDFVASAVTGGQGDLLGFYNGYHLYPGLWQEDPATGSLVNGIINPELKKPLAKLQEMYKDGQIDKEFGVKDRWKVGEDIAAGKLGMFYGANWAVFVGIIGNHKNNSNADWKAYPMPSIDDKPAMVSGKLYFPGVYVAKKGFKNPEALIKLANLSIETLYGKYAQENPYEVGDKYQTVKVGDKSYAVSAYQIVNMYPGDKNLKSTIAVIDVLDNGGDPSKLSGEAKGNYDYQMKWKAGEKDDVTWQMAYIHQANTIIAQNYFKNNLFQPDKFNTIQTGKMVEKQASLDDLASTVFTKIIMGESVDTFDKFVQDWGKLGGDDITKEVNEWYKTTK